LTEMPGPLQIPRPFDALPIAWMAFSYAA
jgi:hypothetical protein